MSEMGVEGFEGTRSGGHEAVQAMLVVAVATPCKSIGATHRQPGHQGWLTKLGKCLAHSF